MDKIKVFIEDIYVESESKKVSELNILKSISVNEKDIVTVTFFNTTKSLVNSIKLEIAKIVKQKTGHFGVIINIDSEVSDDIKPKEVKNDYIYIAIESGKGGVGKSMVAANIAVSLASITNTTVGIIDCDVYGPTIPLLFDRDSATLKGVNDKIFPERVDNIEIISTAFLTPDNSPVMWRAPMLSKLLKSFFTDVVFSADVKYIILDMPPGTGDVSIDLKTLAPEAKVVIVTTRDAIASKIALKAGLGAKQLGLDVIGVVENMTNFIDNDLPVFGTKNTEIEKLLDTTILGSVPFLKTEKLVSSSSRVYFDLIVNQILDKLNF